MTVEAQRRTRIAAVGPAGPGRVNVVDDPQIEVAIAVEIRERAARAPAVVADACGRRGVRERAITMIPIQAVAAVAGDVEIRPPVAVVVAGTGAHTVAAVLNA